MDSLATAFPFKDPLPIIDAAQISQDGKVVSVSFNVLDDVTEDGDRAFFVFEFSSAWLHASTPLLCSKDYYRKFSGYYSKVCPQSRAVSATPVKNGLVLSFESTANGEGLYKLKDTYPACYLFAYAPFVATLKSSSPEAVASHVDQVMSTPIAKVAEKVNEMSLINYYAQHMQKPWSMYPQGHPKNLMNHSQLKMPSYDAELVRTDLSLQRKMLLDIVADPGIVYVYNFPIPKSYDQDSASQVLYRWFQEVFGKPNQHHSRRLQVFQVKTKFGEKPIDSVAPDYDLEHNLNMHTDGVNYRLSGSYLQANWQAVGNVTTRITDGFAATEYLKEKYPQHYEMLTNAQVVHGGRHQLYGIEGNHSALKHHDTIRAIRKDEDYHEVELITARRTIGVQSGIRRVRADDKPIQLQESSLTTQINHSPVKIGINPFGNEKFEKYLAAYDKFYDIVEGREPGFTGSYIPDIDWPQDSLIIFNNQRMLHGRAKIIDEGLQPHLYRKCDNFKSPVRPVPVGGESFRRDIDQEKTKAYCCSDEDAKEKYMSSTYRRQLLGAYANRGVIESRLRLLSMKMLEKLHSENLEMKVFSELDDLKIEGASQRGDDVLARWLPRCPTKIIERLIPSPNPVDC